MSEDDEECGVVLNHLDRIFIGVNTMFVFRYPLQKYQRDKIAAQMRSEWQGEVDETELQHAVEQKLYSSEMLPEKPKNVQDLICEEYLDSQIEEDNKQVDFDKAYEEAKHLEDIKKQELIQEQQKERELERQRMAEEYNQLMKSMKDAEEKKINELKLQQEELRDNLKKKEEEVGRIALLEQQQSKENKEREEMEAAHKMDKAEMEKLQEQLEKVQKEIEAQRVENARKIQEQQRAMQQKILEEEEAARLKKEKTLMEYNSNALGIREANEICKLIGKRLKFK